MKVLLIGDYYGLPSALATYTDVVVHTMGGYRPQEQVPAQIQTTTPFRSRGKLDPRAAWDVRRAIRQVRPDIVHCGSGRPLASALLATAFDRDPPKIVSFRGVATPPRRFDPANWISYLHPRVAGHACESDAVRDALVDGGVAAERCCTTYGCVRPWEFANPGRSARSLWGIPDDAFVVGTVATMRPVKGIDLLLRAAVPCADLPNVWWLLIGPIRDQRIHRLIRHPAIAGRVRAVGFQPRQAGLIAGADLFVMPSRSDALCRALLEAMSLGICPVVSDAGGLKEAVRHGQDGLVFPRENVAALAAAIRALHADRAALRRYGLSAAHRAREFFSPRQMALRTIRLYEQVLGIRRQADPIPAATASRRAA